MADYYDLLGDSRDADSDTLKRAYRQQARKKHPEVNKEAAAEEKIKEIEIDQWWHFLRSKNKRWILQALVRLQGELWPELWAIVMRPLQGNFTTSYHR